MTRTHNEAIAHYKAGNIGMAWTVAQQDEGLSPHVDIDTWLTFAERCVANERSMEAAYADER